MTHQSHQVGLDGEACATRYLQARGYRIRDRNVRQAHDEIDILAYDSADDALVFVEVKSYSRRYDADSHPAKSFTPKKKRKTLRAARQWVAQHEYEGGYRVDLVCVVGNYVVEHIKEVNGEF